MTKYEAGDEILFTDIEKGDVIRRTQKFDHGTTSIIEGTAVKSTDWYWDTEEGQAVAFDTDDDDNRVLVELVERPTPKLPYIPGTIIKAKKVRDSVGEFILFLSEDDCWRSALTISDKTYGGNYYWHPEDRIKDWVVMELVTKK